MKFKLRLLSFALAVLTLCAALGACSNPAEPGGETPPESEASETAESESSKPAPEESESNLSSESGSPESAEPPYEGAPFSKFFPPTEYYYSREKVEALEESIFITDEETLNSAAGSVTLTCPEAALDYLAGILLGNESPLQKSINGGNFLYIFFYENEGDKIFDESTAIYDKFGGVYYDYTDENTYWGDFFLEYPYDCEKVDSDGKTYYEIYLIHSHELSKGSGYNEDGSHSKAYIVRSSRGIDYAVYPDGTVKVL